MKLAIIGNSHVGMLRAASSEPAFSGVSFGWFANAGRGLEGAKVNGTRIIAKRKALRNSLARMGLSEQLDVHDYDAAVFVGTTASAMNAAYVARGHVVAHWLNKEMRAQIVSSGANRDGKDLQLVSEAAFVATLCDHIRAQLTYEFVADLRRATDRPLFIVPQPYWSDSVLLPHAAKYRVFRKVAPMGSFQGMSQALACAHDTVFSEFDGVTVLRQPAVSVSQHLFTKAEFSQGSVRLDLTRAHEEADMMHANAALGILYLGKVLGQFS